MPKKKASNKETKHYQAVLTVLGQNHRGIGATVYEAIGNIQVGKIAGSVILTVEEGKNSKERVIPTRIATRAFNLIGMTREVALNQLAKMYDGV